MHRISNRIGWVKKPTTIPDDTRKALQSWLPFELWSEVNHLMVGFGQTICLPISPICNECLNRDICPSSGKGRKSPKKSPVKQEMKSEVEEDLFEQKKDIPILKLEPAKPKKKKVTPKKEAQKAEETEEGKLTVVKSTKNNVSPKNKVTNKDVPDNDNNETMDDFKVPSKVIKSPNTQANLNVEDKSNTKRSPMKRKSPRNKVVDQVDVDNNSIESVVQKKKNRSGKKK